MKQFRSPAELLPEHLRNFALTTPLTRAEWRALSSADVLQLFFVTCCLMGETYRTSMRQLQRGMRIFLLANDCPSELRVQYRGPWLRDQLVQHGFQPRSLDGVNIYEGLALRGAPLTKNEYWQVTATARRIALHLQEREERDAEPQWRYWDPSEVVQHFLRENCDFGETDRLPLRDLKTAALAWRTALRARLPVGKKSAFADDFIRSLRDTLAYLGYRIVVPNNVPHVVGLDLKPAVRTSLGLPANERLRNLRANVVRDALTMSERSPSR